MVREHAGLVNMPRLILWGMEVQRWATYVYISNF